MQHVDTIIDAGWIIPVEPLAAVYADHSLVIDEQVARMKRERNPGNSRHNISAQPNDRIQPTRQSRISFHSIRATRSPRFCLTFDLRSVSESAFENSIMINRHRVAKSASPIGNSITQ